MKLLPVLLCALPLCADPLLFYSKSFPNSRPDYMEVRLTRDGLSEYRESPTEDPLRFKLTPADTEAFFALAEKLGHFSRPLESGLPVARMGEKTFRWEDGGKKTEVKFNWSTDLDAQALHENFEKICESGQYYYILERAVKYDRIGVYNVLLKLEAAWDRKRLMGVDLFIPLLDRVVKNDGYLNIARERAEKLAATFRGKPLEEAGKPAAQ